MSIFYFSYIYVFIFVSVVRPHFFIEAVACHQPPLLFPVQSYGGPVRCQVPGRDLLIWLKLSWKPSANNSYLGIPEKFLPNSLAF